MNMKRLALAFGTSFALLWVVLAGLSMAQDGFIRRLPPEPPSKDLPPEAKNLRHEVLHQVSSKENLHILAGYYYGDPRQWKKIYQANRSKIRNPNRLTVGQILRIPVPQDWSPRYAYNEWFQLATRGGEWVPRSRKGASVTPSGGESVRRGEPQIEEPQLEKPELKAPEKMQPPAEKKEGSQM